MPNEVLFLILGIGIGLIAGMLTNMILKGQPFVVIYENEKKDEKEEEKSDGEGGEQL